MSQFSGPGQKDTFTTNNTPISGDKPKLFDYGNAVPSGGDTKPSPNIKTPTEGKGVKE